MTTANASYGELTGTFLPGACSHFGVAATACIGTWERCKFGPIGSVAIWKPHLSERKPNDGKTQSQKCIEAARKLGIREHNDQAFREAVREVVSARKKATNDERTP